MHHEWASGLPSLGAGIRLPPPLVGAFLVPAQERASLPAWAPRRRPTGPRPGVNVLPVGPQPWAPHTATQQRGQP